MNLEKFNPKKVKELPLKNYNILLKNGRPIQRAMLTFSNDFYFFANELGAFELREVDQIAPYTEYSYVPVGNGFALTRDGCKCFKENIYGVIDNEQHAQYYIFNMNNNANRYTTDAINLNDIVVCIQELFYTGSKAIVTSINKPTDIEDHGTIEVYLLKEQIFEHFTYSGWNEFLEVVEEYN
jgi:hypothetical protein